MTTTNSEPAAGGGARRAPAEPVVEGGARRLALHFAVALVVGLGLGLFAGGPRGALSGALGVGLSGANLLLMRRITSALATPGGGAAVWALALPFKLVLLVAIAYALVATGVAEPVPLAMGFALLPLTGVFLPRASSVPHLTDPPRVNPAAPPGASLSPRLRRAPMK